MPMTSTAATWWGRSGKLVTSEELSTVVGGEGLEAMADRLIDLTLERGAPDNVSVVLVRVISSPAQ